MERVAEVSVNKGPLAGRVDLRIENVENTVQAQINSLNNIIRQKPDAILVDAGSGQRAEPDDQEGLRRRHRRHQLRPDRHRALRLCASPPTGTASRRCMAEWMATQLGGKGNVIVDRGLAGAPISAQLQDGFEKVLAEHPDIEVVGYYNGEYALGPEQSGVAALLAANPQIDGMLTQGYGSGAIQALKDAGRPIVPVVAFSYNVSALACARDRGAKCILGSNPAYLSSEAIKLAVDILDTGNEAGRRATSRWRATSSPPTRSSPSSIPARSCRRSRSARTPFPTSRRA